jgi:hypothetical protein
MSWWASPAAPPPSSTPASLASSPRPSTTKHRGDLRRLNGVLGILRRTSSTSPPSRSSRSARSATPPAPRSAPAATSSRSSRTSSACSRSSRRTTSAIFLHRRQRLPGHRRQDRQARQQQGYELRVIGVPKTIDNDLPVTDHCPGYGSVIKYICTTVRELACDNEAMGQGDLVSIVEVMGRSAGWIAAGTALAKRRDHPHDPPHLIYLPEVPFSQEKFLEDVRRVLKREKYCLDRRGRGPGRRRRQLRRRRRRDRCLRPRPARRRRRIPQGDRRATSRA